MDTPAADAAAHPPARTSRHRRACAAALAAALVALAACTAPLRAPGEAAQGRAGYEPIADRPAPIAASTAHPLATRAALDTLAAGGSAIDAAIAAQMVLGLVEPQSSGIGGGALVMHWDARARRLRAYDGLAAAPARVTASLRTDVDGSLLPAEPSRRGGRTVGVPGTLAVLELAHAHHGRLAWARLFAPAIALARSGYPMAPYVHEILAQPGAADDLPALRATHFDDAGRAHPPGTVLRNPAHARVLREIAAGGNAGWLAAGGSRAIVAAAQQGFRPSLMQVDDPGAYRAREREPLCAPFLAYRVCAMSPPSFGGVVVLQMLQMLEAGGGAFDFGAPEFAHRYVESGRLAQADRRHWIGDPAFVDVPAAGLVAPTYVRSRAASIDPARARRTIPAGDPLPRAGVPDPHAGPAAAGEPADGAVADATSQIAIVDARGDAVAITTTINLNFGARLAVDGIVLNNAMTNFAAAPRAGAPMPPNALQPRKRPVTSMAPLIVFDAAGEPVIVGGSAGGGQIVDYIARALIEMLANGLTPARALARGHVTTALAPTVQLEAGTEATRLADALRARGHRVQVAPTRSGAGFLRRVEGGWLGAADPRRDGVALGGPVR